MTVDSTSTQRKSEAELRARIERLEKLLKQVLNSKPCLLYRRKFWDKWSEDAECALRDSAGEG